MKLARLVPSEGLRENLLQAPFELLVASGIPCLIDDVLAMFLRILFPLYVSVSVSKFPFYKHTVIKD